MTYVERLLTNQGRVNRRLGEEILQQRHLEAVHAAANEPRLKGALGWSLAGVTLTYVLVVAAVGAIAL